MKEDALRRLLDSRRPPDIIVGDFNGERSPKRARKTLATHPVFQQLRSKQDQTAFLQYYRRCHQMLGQRGYVPAYRDTSLVTSRYGGLPDWVYVRRGLGATVQSVKVVPADTCSDHHAVLVRLRLG